jgi:hypothetical protein
MMTGWPLVEQNPEQLARRQKAAQLLEDVLDERMEPRLAINRWPEPGDMPDASLDTAWQALWHFEADEDKQQSELFYLDAQLELLRQIARFLKEGRDLPAYFLQPYPEDHQVRFFYDLPPVQDSLRLLRQVKARFWTLWSTAWELNPWLKTQKPPQN